MVQNGISNSNINRHHISSLALKNESTYWFALAHSIICTQNNQQQSGKNSATERQNNSISQKRNGFIALVRTRNEYVEYVS